MAIYRLMPLDEEQQQLLLVLQNESDVYKVVCKLIHSTLEDTTSIYCATRTFFKSPAVRTVISTENSLIKQRDLELVFYHLMYQATEDRAYENKKTWLMKLIEVAEHFPGHVVTNYIEEITEEFKKHKDAAKEFCEDSKALHEKVTEHIQQQEKKTMPLIENVKITNVTYLDGRDVNDIGDQELITAIQAKESRIEALRKQKTESKRVNQIIAELNTDIEKLVEILDSRVVEDKTE